VTFHISDDIRVGKPKGGTGSEPLARKGTLSLVSNNRNKLGLGGEGRLDDGRTTS
jgi:hypothetical protein